MLSKEKIKEAKKTPLAKMAGGHYRKDVVKYILLKEKDQNVAK